MSNSRLFMLFLSVVAMGAYAMIAFDLIKRKDKNNKLKELAKYNRRYHFYGNFIFTRRQFRRIVEAISQLQLYSVMEIRIRSVKTFQTTMLMCLATLVLGMLSVDDIVLFCILVLFVIVMNDTLVHKKIDASQADVHVALSHAISSLRDNYTRYGEIPEAIRTCDRDPILDRTFDNIYAILTETNGEELLDQFYLTQQSPVLRTLATVCHALDKYGDAPIEYSDIPSFKQALMFIKDEVDMQVRNDVKKKLLFRRLEFLPVVPVMFIGLVEWFFMYVIPGTSLLYKGFYGYCMKIGVIILAMWGFTYISNVNRANYSRVDDRFGFIDWLLDHKAFSHFINDIVPKKAKTRHKYDQMISGCLSNKDLRYIYAEKIIYSTLVFILAFSASFLIVHTSKSYIYDNTMTMSLTQAMEYTEDEERQVRALDAKILARDSLPDDDTLYSAYEKILFHASVMDLDDQVSRIKTKYTSYHEMYYHWWFVLIVLGITGASWFIPELLLKQRRKFIQNEAEEDVLQMQTIVLILSTTLLDTQEVLYWLSKNSGVHRDHLNFAYQEYPSDPEKAIARLKKNSVIPEFHQLCDKLSLTAFRISLAEAFSDLVPERQHLMKIREMVQDNTLEGKRRKSSPLAQAPLYLLIFGLVVGPVIILGISQYMRIMPQVSSM